MSLIRYRCYVISNFDSFERLCMPSLLGDTQMQLWIDRLVGTQTCICNQLTLHPLTSSFWSCLLPSSCVHVCVTVIKWWTDSDHSSYSVQPFCLLSIEVQSDVHYAIDWMSLFLVFLNTTVLHKLTTKYFLLFLCFQPAPSTHHSAHDVNLCCLPPLRYATHLQGYVPHSGIASVSGPHCYVGCGELLSHF